MHRITHYVPSGDRVRLCHRASFRLAARGGFGGSRPVRAKFFRAADDAIDEIGRGALCWSNVGSSAIGGDFEELKLLEDRFHGAFGVAEKLRAANPGENPSHAFEDGLAVHVFGKFFKGMIAVAVALDGEAIAVAFDDQIDAKRPHAPMGSNAIAGGHQALHDFALEGRLGALLFFFERAHEAAGVLRVFDQLAAKIVGLEIVVGIERVDNPHLVAGAAGGDVETLLEQFLVAEGEQAALRGVHQRDKDYVAFVALELRGVSAEEAMELVAVRGKMTAEQVIDLQRLFVADQRNHAEAGRLSGIVFLVFRLLDCGGEERGSSQGFLTIDFAVAARAGDAISDGVRPETNAAGVAQRFDAPIVGNHVAELHDLRNATEMLDKAGGAAEGLAREIVDGDLAVIEIGIGDARKVLEDEILNDAQILTDGGGAYLLVVADNEDGFSQIERDESHDIALAGFVDDDDVKARDARVEIFNDAGKRHHPDGNGAAAFGHFSGRFGTQERNTNAVAFADAANGVQPADQRLPLSGGGAVGLRGPRAFVNEADGGAAELLAKFLAFRLQGLE